MATTDGNEYTAYELREMDEQTARQTLTVAQFERWEKIQSLHDEAEETRERWEEQAEEVAEIAVHADVEQLGTEVDLFGNETIVHIDSADDEFRETAERLDDYFGEFEAEEIDELGEDRQEEIADGLTDMLGCVLERWNGHDWEDLPPDVRRDVLAQCREKWGVDGLLLAWVDIAAAVNEDREEKLDVIEKFRNPERRGNR